MGSILEILEVLKLQRVLTQNPCTPINSGPIKEVQDSFPEAEIY